MKKKITQTAARTATPAEISITVTQFQDVLAAEGPGRGTGYKMSMKRRHPHVVLEGDTIKVWRPGAIIQFTLGAIAGDQEKYYPAGITFVRAGESRSDPQRLGRLNFPQECIRLDGRTLTFVDSYRDKTKKIRYKFSVVVQRGSDGKIGLIDPDIVHEDEQ